MKILKAPFAFALILLLFACNRKTSPTSSRSVYGTESKTETTTTTTKPVATKKIKTPTPKVIVVNDASASKAVDGRLYYDLDGKRYWRNYKDGKYYIFSKSMSSNPDFKKP